MNTLKVQKRDMAKKAKELRREGFVTGTLFGKELNGSIPIIIEEKDLEDEKLIREILDLKEDPEGLRLMAEASRKCGPDKATEIICDKILEEVKIG